MQLQDPVAFNNEYNIMFEVFASTYHNSFLPCTIDYQKMEGAKEDTISLLSQSRLGTHIRDNYITAFHWSVRMNSTADRGELLGSGNSFVLKYFNISVVTFIVV